MLDFQYLCRRVLNVVIYASSTGKSRHRVTGADVANDKFEGRVMMSRLTDHVTQ